MKKLLITSLCCILGGCAGFNANIAVDKDGNYVVTSSGKLPDNKKTK